MVGNLGERVDKVEKKIMSTVLRGIEDSEHAIHGVLCLTRLLGSVVTSLEADTNLIRRT